MNAQSSTIDRLPPAAQDAPAGSAPAHRGSAALPVGPADWSAWVLERMHDANAGLMQNWPLARAWLSGTVPRAAHAAAAAAVAEPRFADVDPPTSIDRLLHAGMGSLTMGISPPSLALAWTDWALHLAMAPGKWQQMSEKAIRKQVRFANYALRSATDPSYPPCITPLPQDRRFRAPGWQSWPYNLVWQAFLLQQQWWHSATTGVGGVSKHHEQVVSFMVRQLLNMISPVNFPATNPEVLEAVIRESGRDVETLVIQKNGGTASTIRKGQDWVKAVIERLEATPCVPMDVSELVIGTVFGGSDGTSG